MRLTGRVHDGESAWDNLRNLAWCDSTCANQQEHTSQSAWGCTSGDRRTSDTRTPASSKHRAEGRAGHGRRRRGWASRRRGSQTGAEGALGHYRVRATSRRQCRLHEAVWVVSVHPPRKDPWVLRVDLPLRGHHGGPGGCEEPARCPARPVLRVSDAECGAVSTGVHSGVDHILCRRDLLASSPCAGRRGHRNGSYKTGSGSPMTGDDCTRCSVGQQAAGAVVSPR